MERLGRELSGRGLLTIGSAARLLGVTVKVLRTRDRDFGVVPEWQVLGNRSPMRCYRRETVEKVRDELERRGAGKAGPLRKGEES